MASLVDLLPDPIARARLMEAAGVRLPSRPGYKIHHVTDWRDAQAVARSRYIDLVVFDPFASDPPAWSECFAFHQAFPSIPLLPYTDAPVECAHEILRMGDLGVTTIVVLDRDDSPYRLRRILADALQRSAPVVVLDSLAAIIPESLVPVFSYLMREARRPVKPSELARVYCRHSKTLREHLQLAGLPTTQTLIGWARLFHAAALLRDPGQGVEHVAHTLDFPSASALRQRLYRYTRLRPQDLMRRDGLEHLLRHFHARYTTRDWQTFDRPARTRSAARRGARGRPSNGDARRGPGRGAAVDRTPSVEEPA